MTAPTPEHRRAWLQVAADLAADLEDWAKYAKTHGDAADQWAHKRLLEDLQAIPVPEVQVDNTVGQDPLPIGLGYGLGPLSTPVEEPVDERPHSRACGMTCRGHGTACSRNCPTRHGREE